MDRYLKETEMLDYSSKNIRQLIAKRKWDRLDAFRRVQAIYNFVRDEILFGYNTDDSIPASKVLADGYGQCNTKGTLFMALLREFDRNNTYIQSEGINQDFGIYDAPDDLLKAHHQEMSPLKTFLYRHLGRHLMNRNVKKIRRQK